MKRKIIVGSLVVTLVGGNLFGASHVLAQTDDGSHGASPLVQKLSDTFHLNKDDVQKVFDQSMHERQVQVQQKFADQLSQYVKDGKLTEAQKQLIIAKRKELEANHQKNMINGENKTPQERRDAMEAERTALETWAKQNGINMQYLMSGFGKHGRMMHEGKWEQRSKVSISPTPVN